MQRRFVFLLVPLTLILGSCNQQDDYSANADKQAAVDAAEKAKELQPALGKFCGTMHLTDSKEDFDVVLNLQLGEDNTHSSASQNPSDTVQIPKIVGSMRFSVIENSSNVSATFESFSDLRKFMGSSEVYFTYGDYNDQDHTVNLPYAVPNYDGNYGAIKGEVDSNGITGIWSAYTYGDVGTFVVTPCKPNKPTPVTPNPVTPDPSPSGAR